MIELIFINQENKIETVVFMTLEEACKFAETLNHQPIFAKI